MKIHIYIINFIIDIVCPNMYILCFFDSDLQFYIHSYF